MSKEKKPIEFTGSGKDIQKNIGNYLDGTKMYEIVIKEIKEKVKDE